MPVRRQCRRFEDLRFPRITRGKVELTRKRVHLADVLTRTAETSRQLIEERGYTLRFPVAEELLEVESDAVRLAQVFTSLLNHAARYTEPGGTTWLTAAREGETVRIWVKDTSEGMTPEVIARVF